MDFIKLAMRHARRRTFVDLVVRGTTLFLIGCAVSCASQQEDDGDVASADVGTECLNPLASCSFEGRHICAFTGQDPSPPGLLKRCESGCLRNVETCVEGTRCRTYNDGSGECAKVASSGNRHDAGRKR